MNTSYKTKVIAIAILSSISSFASAASICVSNNTTEPLVEITATLVVGGKTEGSLANMANTTECIEGVLLPDHSNNPSSSVRDAVSAIIEAANYEKATCEEPTSTIVSPKQIQVIVTLEQKKLVCKITALLPQPTTPSTATLGPVQFPSQ